MNRLEQSENAQRVALRQLGSHLAFVAKSGCRMNGELVSDLLAELDCFGDLEDELLEQIENHKNVPI